MTTHFHYTFGHQVLRIVIDRFLRPHTLAEQFLPIVWLSRNPTWEPAVRRFWSNEAEQDNQLPLNGKNYAVLSMQEMADGLDGIFRFGVDSALTPLHAWPKLAEVSRMDPRYKAQRLQNAAETGADPCAWAGTLNRIPEAHWRAFEYWDAGAWLPVNTAKWKVVVRAGTERWRGLALERYRRAIQELSSGEGADEGSPLRAALLEWQAVAGAVVEATAGAMLRPDIGGWIASPDSEAEPTPEMLPVDTRATLSNLKGELDRLDTARERAIAIMSDTLKRNAETSIRELRVKARLAALTRHGRAFAR